MPYQIEYLPTASKGIRKLPYDVQRRLFERIGTLVENARPPGSIKLKGEDAYRIRVGDYRVIYTIHDDRLIVLIIDVGHRRDVYRR